MDKINILIDKLFFSPDLDIHPNIAMHNMEEEKSMFLAGHFITFYCSKKKLQKRQIRKKPKNRYNIKKVQYTENANLFFYPK